VYILGQHAPTMSQYKTSDDWAALSHEQLHQRLSQLVLTLCENNKIVICIHYKYAPSLVSSCPNRLSAHPYLIVQHGMTCLQCGHCTTSTNLTMKERDREKDKEKVHRLAEVATLGWCEVPSLMRGQYISQLLVARQGATVLLWT
jgi:hypothetical protein